MTPIEVLMGPAVAHEIVRQVAAFASLKTATIVTYTLQDYVFDGHGSVSDLLRRQMAHGAEVTLVTTPPPYNPEKRPYRDKLALLETLAGDGIRLLLNEFVHAKVYLFTDTRDRRTAIVGSANLTHAALGGSASNPKRLLELSWLSGSPDVYARTAAVVASRILSDRDTVDFATWRSNNTAAIATAKQP